jgi:hypothetical protein
MDLQLTDERGLVHTFLNAKAARYPVPLLDVAKFGAIADAQTPEAMAANAQAFGAAFAEAKATRSEVIARRGVQYWLNKSLRQDSIAFHCEADLWFSDGTPKSNAGLVIAGNAPRLNLTGSINSTATQRGGGAWGQHCVTVGGAVDFEIFGGGLVSGAACVGIFLQAAKRGQIIGMRSRNTKADSFHNTWGTSDVLWQDCAAEGGGDDMMAVVSYNGDGRAPDGKGGVICERITVRRFRGQNNKWGRGLAVVGGRGILFEDAHVQNVNGFGLYVASEGSPYYARGTNGVTFRRVTVDTCGLAGYDWGDGLRVYGRAGVCSMGLPQTVEGVALEDVQIIKPRRFGALLSTTYAKPIDRAGLTCAAPWREMA